LHTGEWQRRRLDLQINLIRQRPFDQLVVDGIDDAENVTSKAGS